MQSQRKGAALNNVKRKAQSRLRLEQARQHAAAGHTLGETAAAIGLTVAGLESLLYRTLGSYSWPPKE